MEIKGRDPGKTPAQNSIDEERKAHWQNDKETEVDDYHPEFMSPNATKHLDPFGVAFQSCQSPSIGAPGGAAVYPAQQGGHLGSHRQDSLPVPDEMGHGRYNVDTRRRSGNLHCRADWQGLGAVLE